LKQNRYERTAVLFTDYRQRIGRLTDAGFKRRATLIARRHGDYFI